MGGHSTEDPRGRNFHWGAGREGTRVRGEEDGWGRGRVAMVAGRTRALCVCGRRGEQSIICGLLIRRCPL